MKRAALTIREHFDGIVQFIRTRITNAAVPRAGLLPLLSAQDQPRRLSSLL